MVAITAPASARVGADHDSPSMDPVKKLVLELLEVAEGLEDFTPGSAYLHPNDIDRVEDLRKRLKDAQALAGGLGIEYE